METVDIIIPAYRPEKNLKIVGFSFHTELSSGKNSCYEYRRKFWNTVGEKISKKNVVHLKKGGF